MKTLIFRGYGDDAFGEYGVTGQDCDNCANEEPIQCIVDCGYSPALLIDLPEGTFSLEWFVGGKKVDQ